MEAKKIQYRQLFELTVARLAAVGIPGHFSHGSEVTSVQIEQVERECGVSLPSSLQQFYFDVGDGLTFKWFIDRSDVSLPFCWLTVPPIAELKPAIEYLRMLNECLSDHDFHEAQDPEFARTEFSRQLSFFPMLRVNADLLCIEEDQNEEAVVFHDHEWSFYDRGVSGTLLATSLTDFWHGWSNVGFVHPKNFWWPGTVGAQGVEWSVDRFGFTLLRAEQ